LSKKIRYLITTADERTWKLDRPVLFLGEWCKTFTKEHIFKKLDSETLSPLGEGQIEKDFLYAEARKFEKKIFPILTEILNQHHDLSYTERMWKIFIGPWLRRNIDVISNRLNTIEKCIQMYSLSGTTAIKRKKSLAPPDALTALYIYGSDDWNIAIFVRILELLRIENCPIEWLADTSGPEPLIKIASPASSFFKKTLKKVALALGKVTKFFSRESDAFIIHTYLPISEQIKLQIALGQFPQFWTIPKLALTNKIDTSLRQQLTRESCKSLGSVHDKILTTLVIETLPSCYLEEFSNLARTVQQLPFPRKPKFIFTSNNFEANEVFQLWAALKINSGTQYYLGQHGNNYGTYRYMLKTIEEETADHFLTWGWKGKLRQHTPAFIFKMSGAKRRSNNKPNGGLLLVENILGHRIYVWDRPYDFSIYLKEQMTFASQLNDHIKKQLVVRLHYSHSNFNACEIERWHDFDSSINVEDGKLPIHYLIEKSRLVVYGYDSTGILESLALNLPTLILMENKFEFLRDEALPYYQILLNAGILHTSPETAAKKVNEIWNHVNEWWNSHEVQAARHIFCNQYSRLSSNPVSDLLKIFHTN